MKKTLPLLLTLAAGFGVFENSMAQLSSNPDKFLGNITTRGQVNGGGVEFSTLWNQITPENESKWGSVEGNKGRFSWSGADACVNYARKNNFPFKFHALIWGAQHPSWFNESMSILSRKQAIVSWMDEASRHYPSLDMIDVANECVAGHQADTYLFEEPLGGSGMTGWDWLVKAFEMAHERWPEAILIYNDFNTFQWNTDQYIDLVTKLRDAGAPIDAYGCQSHDLTDCNINTFKNSMQKIQNALKMPMYISEYDLGTHDDNVQERQISQQFPVMWEADYCAGVTFWGYIFGATWTTDGNSGLIKNGKDRPAMTWLRNYMETEAAKTAKSPFPGMKKEISLYIKPAKYKSPIGEPCDITVDATMHNGTTIEKVELFINDNLAATMTEAPYIYEYTPENESKVNFKAIAYASDGKTFERLGGMYGTKYKQGPFDGEPLQIPGTLEAENFDLGEEGISFHDSDKTGTSSTAAYRQDGGGVDLFTVDGGYAVGKTEKGEWLNYSVNFNYSGKHKFEAVVGCDKSGETSAFTLLYYRDGDLKGMKTIEVPYTGRKKYTTVTGDMGMRFNQGEYTIKLRFDKPNCYVDKIVITSNSASAIDEIEGETTYAVFDLLGAYLGDITANGNAEINEKIKNLTGRQSFYIIKDKTSGRTQKVLVRL